jgi:hypothetical protein
MEPKVAFQNLANLADFATQRGGIPMHQVVAIHQSLQVIAKALGIEPAAQAPAVVPAPQEQTP